LLLLVYFVLLLLVFDAKKYINFSISIKYIPQKVKKHSAFCCRIPIIVAVFIIFLFATISFFRRKNTQASFTSQQTSPFHSFPYLAK